MLIKIISLMLCMTYIKTCDKKLCATCPKKNTCGHSNSKLRDLEDLPADNHKSSHSPVKSPRSSSQDEVKARGQ